MPFRRPRIISVKADLPTVLSIDKSQKNFRWNSGRVVGIISADKILLRGLNMIHEKKVYTDETVTIDNNEYIMCEFNDCEIVYGATGHVGLQSCAFNKVKWSFTGAASNTIAFLTALYQGAGAGGQQLVEQTFDNIRKGQHPGKDTSL